MPSLFEISSDLNAIDDILDTIEGTEIPPELQAVVDGILEERSQTWQDAQDKIDNYCLLIKSRQGYAQTRKAEADRLTKLADRDNRFAEYLKARLKYYLESTNQDKIKTKRFDISVCNNGGKQPVIMTKSLLPEELPYGFTKTKVEVDNDAIRKALEAGEVLEFAELGDRQRHLRIN